VLAKSAMTFIALSTLPEGEHKAVAVAARDLDNAKKFGDTHGINKTFGSYEQLVYDKEIGFLTKKELMNPPTLISFTRMAKWPLCSLALKRGFLTRQWLLVRKEHLR